MPVGTREISSPPATIAIEGSKAAVTLGELAYRFGASADEKQPMLEVVGKDSLAKPYTATILKSGGMMRTEEKF
jgi:hypothetical protein